MDLERLLYKIKEALAIRCAGERLNILEEISSVYYYFLTYADNNSLNKFAKEIDKLIAPDQQPHPVVYGYFKALQHMIFAHQALQDRKATDWMSK